MHSYIAEHFQKTDPILFSAAQKVGPIVLTPIPSSEYFPRLCRTIIGQQLSTKVADTLGTRFKALFDQEKITPEKLLKIPDEKLREIGISWTKAKYLKNLAEGVVSGQLELDKFDQHENEVITMQLTQIKGIGPWTAEMFLMFSLGREDIFSFGDLGLQRAVQKLYGLKRPPTPKYLTSISKKWSPYRTYACRVLWNSLDLKI
jgi:DNA-3-methyladenine glycosylase II